jgi:hypothetical protein
MTSSTGYEDGSDPFWQCIICDHFFLNHLAHALDVQFKSTNQLHDLDEIIDLGWETLRYIPVTHPDQSTFLNNLADDLHTRFKLNGRVHDLDKAIELGRDALKFIPVAHSDWSIVLKTLASALCTQLDLTDQQDHSDEATALQRELEGVELQTGPHGQDQNPSTADSMQNMGGSAL